MSGSIHQAAQKILDSMRAQYRQPLSLVETDLSEFKHLELNHYEAFTKHLKKLGFRPLVDVEILTVSQAPNSLLLPTVIRSMVSSNGRYVCTYYQAKTRRSRMVLDLIKGIMNLRWVAAPKNFIGNLSTKHCISFETEYRDGLQITTSNAEAAGMISSPKQLQQYFLPYQTKAKTLFEEHRQHLSESGRNKLEIVLVAGKDQFLAMQNRQQELKNAHRKALNWVTREELLAMAGGNASISDAIYQEIQNILRQEAAS